MKKTESEWIILVEEIAPELYRYFLGSFNAPSSADLVQETLIRLVTKCRKGEFNHSQGNIKSYAFGIARFVRLEELKKKSLIELVEDESQFDKIPHQDTSEEEQIERLRWAITRLSPIEQDLILQMINEESTFEAIAKQFSMPVGTVKSHIHRAKEKLRKILEVKL